MTNPLLSLVYDTAIDPSIATTATDLVTAPGGGGVPWTPSDLSTSNKIWWDPTDATTITESGNSVSEWRDKIGGVIKLTQGTGSNQLATNTATINSENVLVSDNDFMQCVDKGANAYPTGMQVTCIMQKTGAVNTNESLLFKITPPDPDGDPLGRYNSFVGGVVNTSPSYVTVNDLRLFTTPTLLSYYVNTTVAGEYQNGTLANEDPHSRTYSDDGTIMYLGVSNAPTYRYRGYWGDIIVTDFLSESERQKLEGYLAHKYGTTAGLPGGHPYKSSAPTV